MANTLLDTGDMAMTTIIRVPIADDVSNEDIEEAMISIALRRGLVQVVCQYLKSLNFKQVKNKDYLKSFDIAHLLRQWI